MTKPPTAAEIEALIARLREVDRLLNVHGSITIQKIDPNKQGSLVTEAADRIAAQAREIERVRELLHESQRMYAMQFTARQQAEARAEAMAKDAERLEAIDRMAATVYTERHQGGEVAAWVVKDTRMPPRKPCYGDTLRAAIDAAIRERKP